MHLQDGVHTQRHTHPLVNPFSARLLHPLSLAVLPDSPVDLVLCYTMGQAWHTLHRLDPHPRDIAPRCPAYTGASHARRRPPCPSAVGDLPSSSPTHARPCCPRNAWTTFKFNCTLGIRLPFDTQPLPTKHHNQHHHHESTDTTTPFLPPLPDNRTGPGAFAQEPTIICRRNPASPLSNHHPPLPLMPATISLQVL